MIETIIKRDGTKEPFQPAKLNNWGKWASNDHVDWGEVCMLAVSRLPKEVSSSELQDALIAACLEQKTWGFYEMAGRLYAPQIWKTIYPEGLPALKTLHTRLVELGLMSKLNYTDDEYALLNTVIDHAKDFNTPHFSLDYFRQKYAIKNAVTGEEFETQQFVYMRMAMALGEHQANRVQFVIEMYTQLANKKLSAPSPNYANLGTKLKGFASCCLYTSGDTVQSLAIGDYIALTMTAASAGIGSNLQTRSLGDGVRGGAISHNGKLPYYASMAKSVKANMQQGRGGACTTYYNGFDPEAFVISQLRNPRSPEDKRNRDLHYALMTNKLFARKVAKDEDAFVFNTHTAPDLHAAFYNGDGETFATLYAKYEADESFTKTYFNPRRLIVRSMSEAFETGVAYLAFMDEMNRHTPFKETIYSSNLCLEIAEPTYPYHHISELLATTDVGKVVYKTTHTDGVIEQSWSNRVWSTRLGKQITTYAGDLQVGDVIPEHVEDEVCLVTITEIVVSKPSPEIALCCLAAMNISELESEKDYADAMYYALKMIDYCIENTHYEIAHLGYTAKQRMNAGVGIMGLATLMAKYQLKYDSVEGLEFAHRVAERHMWHAIKASLRISKERGLAPWIHKTKWVDGWTPMETYNRNVDTLGEFENQYDWDALSAEIKANGGLAHSTLVAYMPGESSSKALGQPNAIYPVRDKVLGKTDNSTTIHWAAPNSDDPNYHYQIAWDVAEVDMIDFYAVIQKWTDQTISADVFRRVVEDEKVPSTELIAQYLRMVKYGLKSRYYYNTHTSNFQGFVVSETISEDCVGGACKI